MYTPSCMLVSNTLHFQRGCCSSVNNSGPAQWAACTHAVYTTIHCTTLYTTIHCTRIHHVQRPKDFRVYATKPGWYCNRCSFKTGYRSILFFRTIFGCFKQSQTFCSIIIVQYYWRYWFTRKYKELLFIAGFLSKYCVLYYIKREKDYWYIYMSDYLVSKIIRQSYICIWVERILIVHQCQIAHCTWVMTYATVL